MPPRKASWTQPRWVPISSLCEVFRSCADGMWAQSRNADLSRQLKSAPTSGSGGADAAQVRSLTERATSAEKRAQNAANQLALLESRLAEVQSRAGAAESKWEARVREYESRLKIAGEKIKTEKQGGKERAMQLESQVRYVPLASLVLISACWEETERR